MTTESIADDAEIARIPAIRARAIRLPMLRGEFPPPKELMRLAIRTSAILARTCKGNLSFWSAVAELRLKADFLICVWRDPATEGIEYMDPYQYFDPQEHSTCTWAAVLVKDMKGAAGLYRQTEDIGRYVL